MIPYFGQEINSGLQAGNAATERAFANLGSIGNVIAEVNRAYKQRKFNSKLEELQAARAQIPGTDTAALEQNDRQLRDLDTLGYAKGLRTTLTPQDYMQSEQHKADMKQRQAEMEFKLQEEEKNGILQAYNQAMGQRRIFTDQKAQLIGTGVATPEATKALEDLQKEIDMYMKKAEKLKKYGETLGIRPEHWYDFTSTDSNTGGGTTSPFSDIQGKEASLAKEFTQNSKGTYTDADLLEFLYGKGLNLNSSQFGVVSRLVDDIVAKGQGQDKERHEKAMRSLALADAKRKSASGEQDSTRLNALNEAQLEFLKNPQNHTYSSTNATRLGTLFKDFKANEQTGGRTVSDLLGSWTNRKLNEEQRKTEYETFVSAMKKMVPVDAAPAATAQEQLKKRRVGQ